MDISAAFEGGAERMVPQAEIVFDRFHIAKAKNDAIDQVRRAEHKQLQKEDDGSLAGTRYAWLKHPDDHSPKQRDAFERLRGGELKTARAWAIGACLERFWVCDNAEEAEGLFSRWYDWAQPVRTEAGAEVREDAQEADRSDPDLVQAPNQQRRRGGLQQQDPGVEVSGPRLPQLRELPDEDPVLLRRAGHGPGAEPLTLTKNPCVVSAFVVDGAWRRHHRRTGGRWRAAWRRWTNPSQAQRCVPEGRGCPAEVPR